MKSRFAAWVPQALIALGVLLGVVIVGEVLALLTLSMPVNLVSVANAITSVPFIAVLVVGGYWLRRSEVSPERYSRIGVWALAGTLFVGSFFLLIALVTQDNIIIQIGVARWGVATGAGAGALVGIFEARAIERAVNLAESRTRNTELKRQNERLEEFANIIAHDLRNPLAVVSGRLEMAREEHDDSNLDTAASSLERMEEIIEDTLTLARSGSVIDEPVPVDLSKLVDRCWGNVDTANATLEAGAVPTINADPDRLQHLFENLFRNAIEHGAEEVTIRVGAIEDGFFVEDDGPGIPEEDRVSVLEAGYSTTQGGTGFGLAIVKQIADAHGWELVVTESESGGARFEITQVNRL